MRNTFAISLCALLGLTACQHTPPLPTPVVDEGLVFACSFDSLEEIEHVLANRGANPIKGRLVEGKRGNALLIEGRPESFVAYLPADEVNERVGCIEFWAQLRDPTSRFSWMEKCNPSFFRMNNGYRTYGMGIAGNNSIGWSGLHGWADGQMCATSWYFDKVHTSYESILGQDSHAWHHYALVWDLDGIGDLVRNDERQTMAIYVDGKLHCSIDYKENERLHPPGDPATAKNAHLPLRLVFLSPQSNSHPNSFLMDEFKIWNFAKTTFDLD